jgi:fido (protein-threonine AMPylation protein)
MDLFKCEDISLEIYVKEVIKLSVDIFRCHPFMDGNKRITQAFMNLYFSKVKLPLLNINLNEKREEYIESLRTAINFKDYSLINGFYFNELEKSINLGKNKVK